MLVDIRPLVALLIACGAPGCGGESGAANDAADSGAAKDGSVDDPSLALTWISIAGGSFQMGSEDGESDEQPVHLVKVPAFEMLRSEVTVSQYAACVEAGECSAPDGSDTSSYNWGSAGPKDERAEHPINTVQWNQAAEFCAWVKGRLPSEAEWEHAARGGGKDIAYPWGNETSTCRYAVMDDGSGPGCGARSTAEVCSKAEGDTDQGLCDMAGNVWEWVEDDWHDSYAGAPGDGSAWMDSPRGDFRVYRGGGWGVSSAAGFRAANRNTRAPDVLSRELGFRCARGGKQ